MIEIYKKNIDEQQKTGEAFAQEWDIKQELSSKKRSDYGLW